MPPSLLWLLATWLVVVLVTLVWGIGNAESKLRIATQAFLQEDGSAITVDISGRDATLYGSVDSEDEIARIVADIDDIPGIREVNSELTVIERPPPEIIPPQVSMRMIG